MIGYFLVDFGKIDYAYAGDFIEKCPITKVALLSNIVTFREMSFFDSL